MTACVRIHIRGKHLYDSNGYHFYSLIFLSSFCPHCIATTIIIIKFFNRFLKVKFFQLFFFFFCSAGLQSTFNLGSIADTQSTRRPIVAAMMTLQQSVHQMTGILVNRAAGEKGTGKTAGMSGGGVRSDGREGWGASDH